MMAVLTPNGLPLTPALSPAGERERRRALGLRARSHPLPAPPPVRGREVHRLRPRARLREGVRPSADHRPTTTTTTPVILGHDPRISGHLSRPSTGGPRITSGDDPRPQPARRNPLPAPPPVRGREAHRILPRARLREGGFAGVVRGPATTAPRPVILGLDPRISDHPSRRSTGGPRITSGDDAKPQPARPTPARATSLTNRGTA